VPYEIKRLIRRVTKAARLAKKNADSVTHSIVEILQRAAN
jgi:hypothetical protein